MKQKNGGTQHSTPFYFELHTSASSEFHSKQKSLLLCLGAKILPREHLVCPRIWWTWSSLLKSSAWTFSFLVSQYASSARTAVLIQVWYGTPISHLLSQYGSTCRLLPCDSASEMSKHMQHAVFCALMWASWAPIVHTLSDNPNDYWQCHTVLEIWGKCRDRSEIVKCLLSCTLLLTLRTKSSFTKDGRPFRASSCTFSRPSFNIQTHLLTMPSLITLSPYTWQIWWWISLGSTFLAFKKWIRDHISQSMAPSVVLNMFNAQEQT